MVVLAEPSHPGEVLKELYLDPLGMSAGALAVQLKVPRTRIERLVKGETAVTADTALRLSRLDVQARRVRVCFQLQLMCFVDDRPHHVA